MANNVERFGFRWSYSANGGRGVAPVEERFCVTGQSFDEGGATNLSLGAGDPVTHLDSGGVRLTADAGSEVGYGIVVGVLPYWNATAGRMEFADAIPSDVSYGTNLERQTKVLVVPVDAGVWEIDADTALTDLAACQTLIGLNADIIHTAASGDLRAKTKLDISTAATTATFVWRIVGISQTKENVDFTGTGVKFLVRANLSQTRTALGV